MPMLEPRNDNRVFLVVVDESPELQTALHYACLRARRTGGRVALLYVMQPPDSQQWKAVEDLMRAEQREQAEATLQRLSQEVNEWAGALPVLYLREGQTRDQLLALIEEEPSISILVLGASTQAEGPGPLVSHLVGKLSGRLRIPVTIVPGGLSDEDLAALT